MNPDPVVAKQAAPEWKQLWFWVVTVVTIVVLVFGGLLYRSVSRSLEAENTLHAMTFSIGLAEKFVTENHRWPASWAELESLSIPDDPPFPLYAFEWPSASAEIQRRVSFDFKADLTAIASQDASLFDAIKPIGPYYSYQHHLGPLLNAVKDALVKQPINDKRAEKDDNEKVWAGMWLFDRDGKPAIHVFGHPRPEDNVSSLLHFLTHEDQGVRASTINWLEAIGRSGPKALAELRKSVEGREAEVQKGLLEAINRIEQK